MGRHHGRPLGQSQYWCSEETHRCPDVEQAPDARCIENGLLRALQDRSGHAVAPPASAGWRVRPWPMASSVGSARSAETLQIPGADPVQQRRPVIVERHDVDTGLRCAQLVAVADEHHGVHGHEVAVEHGRRLHQALAQRDRRELQGQPTDEQPGPRLTESANARKWTLQLTICDQELQMPTIARPPARTATLPRP